MALSNVGIVIQARMSSQRLPGKILHRIYNKPMLMYLVDSLHLVSNVEQIIVATSEDPSDLPITEFCDQVGIDYYCGSLANVSLRVKDLINTYSLDGFVRISGDSPLMDYRIVQEAVQIFRENDFDLVTNVLIRTYPKGQSVEVLKSDTFLSAYKHMTEEGDLEHVTPYFYRHPDQFKIENMALGSNYGRIQLSVDTEHDMEMIKKILSQMDKPHWSYTLQETIQLYQNIARCTV